MYFVIVFVLLLAAPAISAGLDRGSVHSASGWFLLFGRWLAFWGVGVRLLLAGLRQTIRPAITAREIFALDDLSVLPVVREIGFGNLSLGVLGMGSLIRTGWVLPTAVAGGLFYGLAGMGHLLSGEPRNAQRRLALASDLFVFVVLLQFALRSW